MRKVASYILVACGLVSCQHELHFPAEAAVLTPIEKNILAIVVTNPAKTDYDSLVFRYNAANTQEVHYSPYGDSVVRSYFYDAAGRLASVEDQKAIYYTNNDRAKRIRFQYNAAGDLQQTSTDFTTTAGITATCTTTRRSTDQQLAWYDTSYNGKGYALNWSNRLIYSTLNAAHELVYDSAIFINTITPGLYKTIVNVYSYGADSSVTSVSKRIYFNGQLSEYGSLSASADQLAPLYRALRRKLYRNLANWFDGGLIWQDDNYHLFPLPGGPYASILYKGFSAGTGASYTRNYQFTNSYTGNNLNKSVIDYSLLDQGTSQYTTVVRFYYAP